MESKSEDKESPSLTIKTTTTSTESSKHPSPSSPYYSPSLLSPPSSAFVSSLQSPYISPRAVPPTPPPPPPLSQSDDIPSSSYTPPSDQYEYSDDSKLLKFSDPPPRISFSFPVPWISFAKPPISPASNAKLRSCDVFIGFHAPQNPNLLRFCKWLKSELELQGIACFIADRAKYSDTQSHEIADKVICSVAYGVVVVTRSTFSNHFSLQEIKFFAQKKN